MKKTAVLFTAILFSQTLWAANAWIDPAGTDWSKKPLKIAFIDTGVDTRHSLLKKFDWSESYDFVDDSTIIKDENGHGTHVSGIVAQHLLKWKMQKNVRLLSLRYYSENWKAKQNMENSLRALEYAIKMNVDIINYSGGGHESHPKELELLKMADKKGIIVVAAAGNDGWNSDKVKYYPANYGVSNIISIGSINSNTQLSEYSNWGISSVDFMAVGNNVFSSLPGNKWGTMSGTSQATAVITSVIAWIFWKNKAPLRAYEIKSELTRYGHFTKKLSGRSRYALYIQSPDWETTAAISIRQPAQEQLALSK